uniref:Carboxylic ester hydrolase n=1 Tax=Panonychus citri TaxID=50023 RepID=I1YD27_PANCT|nr:esterase 7 [Panonychus citri]
MNLEEFKMYHIVYFFLINIIVVNCSIRPLVTTRYGPIEGTTGSYIINDQNFGYQAFLGIPFAEPPIGDKRFSIPVPFTGSWTEPYQATYFRDGCMQNAGKVNFNISEDCLYLNVWRPEFDLANSSSPLLPVYYHVHGSAFIKNSGATPDYQGDVLAATQQIITVNSNHRLGVFGFGYGSPEGIPGNVAIYDILATLKWIQDNIQSFGGDPKRVTLSGLSSGGKIATILATSPSEFNARSLFSRAIMMSGSSTDRHQIESSEIGAAKMSLLASKVNCSSQCDQLSKFNSRLSFETINCLKKQPADVLLRAQNSKEINAIGAAAEYVFLPVYGTQLIPGQAMVNHIKNLNSVSNLPMLFGFEKDEPKPFPSLEPVVTLESAYNYTKEEVTYALKNITKDQIDSIFKFYFSGADPNNIYDLKSRSIRLTSDVNFNCPSLILSQLNSLVNDNIFLYENVYIGQNLSRPFGTQHSDDQKFGQGAPYREPDSFTSTDRQFSSLLMKIYGDFVKGIVLTDWIPVHLNRSDPSKDQTVRQLSLEPRNVLYKHQKACIEWAKLFDYQFPLEN